MPSTLNNFFRPNSGRKASFTSSSTSSSQQTQQQQQRSSDQSASASSFQSSFDREREKEEEESGGGGNLKTPIATPNPAVNSLSLEQQQQQGLLRKKSTSRSRNQHSLPSIITSIEEADLTREHPVKSSSVPSIEIISPSGNTPRHLWGPEDGDQNSDKSPSLSAISSDQIFQSISPKSQPISTLKSVRSEEEDLEEEDPLFSLSSTPNNKKMTRPSSSGKMKGESMTAGLKRGNKGDIPDRHDVMRKAMADATNSDFYGITSAPAFGNEKSFSGLQHPIQPSAIGPSPAVAAINRTKMQEQNNEKSTIPLSQSSGSIVDHEKPGEGSLTFDHFAGQKGEGAMVLADGSTIQSNTVDGGAMTKSESGGSTKKALSKFPLRPKLGSRNNSFQSDTGSLGGGGKNPLNDSPTNSLLGHGSQIVNQTNSPAKNPGHGRYATTGHAAEPVKSKQSSLAIPGSNGTLDATSSNGRHHMHESASAGSLLHSPLQKIRRLSDAGGSKKGGPSGGIAGALAASGMAGMGVGHAELLQRAQQKLNEREEIQKKAQARSRSSSIGSNYATGYEGGVYRDPITGKMTERGPGQDSIDSTQRPYHNRSGTLQSSNASFDGSDISTQSGLNAAANFAIGLQQHDFLSPEDPLLVAQDDLHSNMTPGGIGAVSGLSPSGLGERVTLGEHDDWHPSDVDAQITGFAVASSKRNAEFHSLFPSVPEDDYLIEDYGCALVREILIQGRLYVSENHVCFYANIFGWVTNITLPFSEIVSVEKRMTAYVIPNAIQIATLHSKNTFASFLSRDTTYDLIVQIWKLSHPSLRTTDTVDQGSDEESLEAADGATISHGDLESNEKVKGDGSTSQPTKKSKRKLLKKKLGIKEGSEAQANMIGQSNGVPTISRGVSPSPSSAKKAPHRKTTCSCEKEKKHFSTIALDTTYPAVPEKLYNLMFTTGFMKEFWTDNQKLMDLQISGWKPNTQNNNLLSREVTYIKPLAGGFGPKQTKCLLNDENIHVDFDDYVIALTTTRTPDVPSGNSFSVKTKTCISWAGGNTSRLLVTCQVEWSGRSMLKSVIDRAAIDGQKQYYKDLDGSIRTYIKEHPSEFLEEGEDREAAVAAITEHADTPGIGNEEKNISGEMNGTTSKGGENDSKSNSFGGAYMDNLQPIFDIISDTFGSLTELSPSVLILGGVVFLLLISNLWALSSSGKGGRDPLDPHRLREIPTSSRSYRQQHQQNQIMPEISHSAEAVAGAVRDVLSEYFDNQFSGAKVPTKESMIPKIGMTTTKFENPREELESLLGLLNEVDERISLLRNQIQDLQKEEKQEL